jgi:hypothetical protein
MVLILFFCLFDPDILFYFCIGHFGFYYYQNALCNIELVYGYIKLMGRPIALYKFLKTAKKDLWFRIIVIEIEHLN